MKELTVEVIQNYLAQRYEEKASSESLFMKLVEEVGEVAEALNKINGRKKDTDDSSLEKELADVIHYTFAIASVNKIDLSSVIIEKDKEASIKYGHKLNLENYMKLN